MKYSCQTKEEEKQGRKETSLSEQSIFRGKPNQQNINGESFFTRAQLNKQNTNNRKKSCVTDNHTLIWTEWFTNDPGGGQKRERNETTLASRDC